MNDHKQYNIPFLIGKTQPPGGNLHEPNAIPEKIVHNKYLLFLLHHLIPITGNAFSLIKAFNATTSFSLISFNRFN
jgi:hypothetical protein